MKLPFAEQAVVEQQKLESYLLSATHAHGRHKQRVFIEAGFTLANVSELRDQLLFLAQSSDHAEELPSPYGRKFVIRGAIQAPRGELKIRTIWMLLEGKPPPKFVTAYPAKR